MDKLVNTDIIKPLVQQHARDAVFYWQQINIGRFSPLITSQKRHHFHQQLNAHLDGLRAAGQEGWDAALKNYARWKADGEAFVCWLLALESDDQIHINILHNLPGINRSQLLRSMAETVAWIPEFQARLILERWRLESDSDEMMLEAWLYATGAMGIIPENDFRPLLEHESPRIRAACCRAVGKLRLHTCQQIVENMLSDSDHNVREEAVLALAWLTPRIDIVNELHSLLIFHLQNAPQRGMVAVQARRKLDYLARLAGLCVPQRDSRLHVILADMPERLRLLTLAYHGDPEQFSVIYKALENEQTSRLAFWAIGFISGLDMTVPEYCSSAPEMKDESGKPLSFSSDDTDIGLVWPNVSAVVTNCRSLNFSAGPLLLGKQISAAYCHELLTTATQAVRFAASWHFAAGDMTVPRIDTRK